jgi:hypothetical protein
MSTFGWVAFGLGVANAVVWVAVVVAARQLYRRIRPQVEPYLALVSGMFGSAAGTGDIDKPIGSSPAATLDQCEYSDHEWSNTCVDADSPTGWYHCCMRCGYVEPVPAPEVLDAEFSDYTP